MMIVKPQIRKFVILSTVTAFIALLGAGIQHGQFHLYNSTIPHVHENGVVHSH